MALPSSAPQVTCTLSEPLLAEGTTGVITQAFLSMDRTIVWAASGETIYKDPVKVDVDPVDKSLSFEVIPVDAEGVLDLAGNLINFWTYQLRVSLQLADSTSKTVNYVFQPIGTELLDLDLVPQVDATSTPPATISGQEVTIYIGEDFDIIDGGTP